MNRAKTLINYYVKDALYEMFSSTKMKKPVVILLMLLVIGCISLPLGGMVDVFYNALAPVGQEGMVITIILFLGGSITFFFGVYTIMNIFYFSNDIEHILPMPFKSRDIVLGKFVAVILNMILYSFVLVVPLLVFGIKSGATIFYYIYGAVAILVTPIFPMIIASTICIVLMRFVNLTKHKDAFKMIAGCMSLILVVLFNLFTQGGGMDQSDIAASFQEGGNSLIGKITGIFITNKYLSYSLVNNNNIEGLVYILAAVLISLCFIFAFYIIGGKFYLKGVIGSSESYSTRQNILKSSKADKLTRRSTPVKALAKRDIKIIFRTPQFFINCIAMLLYMPAIFGIMFVSNGSAGSIKQTVQSTDTLDSKVLAAVFFAIVVSISAGGAGITALSREGKDFMISKYIPVSYETHIHSKIISSLCINEVSAVLVTLIMILLGVNPLIIVLGSIIAASTVLLITLTGMYFDYKSPKLEWEDERSLMKNNWMPLLIMLLMMTVGGVFFLISLFVDNPIVMFVILIIAIGLFCYMFYKKLLVLAEKLYNEN
jgi:ABC-2 type transport system permease protein